MAKEERFISGVYNYCDYWCDRCPFTRRCRNFAMGQELEAEAKQKTGRDDAANLSFWNSLADKLNMASVVQNANAWAEADVEEDALNANAFLHEDDSADDMDDLMRKDELLREQVSQHPLPAMAMDYMRRVEAWLTSSDADLKALAQEWMEAAKTPGNDRDYEELARSMGDMIEVITWYHTLLYPKISRALRSLFEMKTRTCDILVESSLQDANGSGKVALIAAERSIAAWLFLRDQLPKQEDAILEMLVLLGRFRQLLHEAIPGAKSFRRPGFDPC